MDGYMRDGRGLESAELGALCEGGFSVQVTRGDKGLLCHGADDGVVDDVVDGVVDGVVHDVVDGVVDGEEAGLEVQGGQGSVKLKRRRVTDSSDGDGLDLGEVKGEMAVGGKVQTEIKVGGRYLLRKRRAEVSPEVYMRLKEQGLLMRQKQNVSPEKRVEDGHSLHGLHSVQTRAMARRSVDWLGMLPEEMWAEILSHLAYTDIGKALCACKSFSNMESYVWRLACANQWPELTARMATVPDRMFKAHRMRWRKCYEMLSLRAAENALVTGWGNTFADELGASAGLMGSVGPVGSAGSIESVDNTSPLQKDVTPRYRSILVEWMIEVAQEWKLESTMIFQATRYLDFYLRTKEIDIGKFQLVGVSAIRLAVLHPRPQMKMTPSHQACLMDPARYAHVCDGAATEQGVVAMTEELDGIISKSMRDAPNAKMYLRCLWYTISKTGISGCTSEDMHVYVLAAFLLELGQTDLAFSTFSHSSLAGASMSLALEFYGKDPWPMSLLAFSSYTSECLVEQRKVLARAQTMSLASNVRDIWCRFYQNHLYHERRGEWDRLLNLMGHRSDDFVKMAFGADVCSRLATCMGRERAEQMASSFRGTEALELDMLRILQ